MLANDGDEVISGVIAGAASAAVRNHIGIFSELLANERRPAINQHARLFTLSNAADTCHKPCVESALCAVPLFVASLLRVRACVRVCAAVASRAVALTPPGTAQARCSRHCAVPRYNVQRIACSLSAGSVVVPQL